MDPNSDKFSIKAFYSFLEPRGLDPFPVAVNVEPLEPMDSNKRGIFAQEVMWERILTLDRLKRRDLSSGNKCFMYKREEEFVDHILLHCNSLRMLQHWVFSMFGIQWVIPLFYKVDVVILEWVLSWEEAEERVDVSPFVSTLDNLLGKKSEGI